MPVRDTLAEGSLSSGAVARVLAACSVGSFLNLATTLIYTFGVYAIAVANDVNWKTQDVAALIGPALLLPIWAGPVTGWLVQRFHKPTIAILAMSGLAAGTLVLALAQADKTLFGGAVVLAVLLAAGAQTMGPAPALELTSSRVGA